MLGCEEEHGDLDPGEYFAYIILILLCVCVAGAVSGLTIGLFSLDRLGLEVLRQSGEASEQRHAARILPLVKKEHLLLVTLLLCNAIANEALPIFLDRILSPVWAVVVSVTLVLIFGEVIPQALFKEHALCIGAWLAPVVHVLMTVCYPITWPITKLLEFLVGHDDGDEVEFKRKQLKTFVRLHGKAAKMGGVLTNDETTMIDGVLELSEKRARDVMVPIDAVFTLSEDTVLDSETLMNISRSGHSRIPVYRDRPEALIGILLVKALITEDLHGDSPPCIADLKLHALPTKNSSTSLFSMLDFFQEGKSHLVLLTNEFEIVEGIITLEDVVEELIKEEIYDETDLESPFQSFNNGPDTPTFGARKSPSKRSAFGARPAAGLTRGDLFGEGLSRSRARSSSMESSRKGSGASDKMYETASLLTNSDSNV